jgi:hypothetical protein
LKVRLPTRLRRLTVLACAGALSLGLAACGKENNPPSAENNGVYETAGNVTYQLQVSRQLNQYSIEDSSYVKGVPLGQGSVTPAQLWYGVFMWAWNQTKVPQTTTSNFDIVDTTGRHYHPLRLNRALNPFAWTAQRLAPNAIQPTPGTVASNGPTQGGLLLFKLPQSVYVDRPLELEIRSPSGRLEAHISLDL